MRRVGSRIQVAIIKWLRTQRRLEMRRFRARWSANFGEYECVGGPLDGQVKPCCAHSVYYSDGGYYRIDPSDMRLHFRQVDKIPSWRRDE